MVPASPVPVSSAVNLTFAYVAIVYVVAVALARRGGVAFPWRIAGFFYSLTLVFFFKALVLDYINIPVDFVISLPPWAYIIPHRYKINGEMNDVALQMVPWAHLVRESWRNLHVPLWNVTAGGGYPLLGNGQSAALSPLRLISLPLSLGHSFTAEAAMKVLAALSFAFLFGRKRGYSESASAVLAVSFGFSTFIIYWLHFPHVTVAAFTPAVFYGIELLLERVDFRRIVFFAGAIVMIVFGGHPETAAHIAFFGALYVFFVMAVERRRDAAKLLGALVGGGMLAVLITLPLLVPLAEGLTKSQRFQAVQANPPGIGRADFGLAVLLFQPRFYGDVEEGTWGPVITEFTTGFAGVLGVAAFVGLLLRLVARTRWRERETFFILMVPLTVCVVLGVPVVSDLFQKLPLFSLAANGRLRMLLCWFLAVLAGAAVDRVQRGESLRYVLAGLAVTAGMLACLIWGIEYPTSWAHDNAIAAAIPSLLVLAAAALLVKSVAPPLRSVARPPRPRLGGGLSELPRPLPEAAEAAAPHSASAPHVQSDFPRPLPEAAEAAAPHFAAAPHIQSDFPRPLPEAAEAAAPHFAVEPQFVPGAAKVRWATALVVFAVTLEMCSAGIRWNAPISPRVLYPWTPMIRKVVELTRPQGAQPPPRIVGLGPVFFPNVSAIFGLQDVRAHDPMANGRYLGLLRIVAGYKTWEYFAFWTSMETTLLDYLNVRYVMTGVDQKVDPARYREVFSSKEGKVFENRDVLPRFFQVPNVILEFNQDRFVRMLSQHTAWRDTAIVHQLHVGSDQERVDLLAPRPPGSPQATLKILEAHGPDYRLEIEAARSTMIVSSEPFWPGWRIIASSGKNIEPMPVNGPFLGFLVPKGKTQVRVVYDPLQFKAAVAVSLLTILCLALYPVVKRRRA
jgi:Bacterial membrane protein YfhO